MSSGDSANNTNAPAATTLSTQTQVWVGDPLVFPKRDHELFLRFPRWEGLVPAGLEPNFLGVMTRTSYFKLFQSHSADHYEKTRYPRLNEEYFEWIDLLEAVQSAEESFTLLELGAGWGRWMANAVAVMKQINDLPYTLVGVEAEPTHFQWMKQHLQENGVDLSRCHLIEAAVTDKDGEVGFYVGETPWGGPSDCYGQSIGGPTKVKALSLNTVLQPFPRVDLIDMDIQGAEWEVLEAAADEVDRRVKRVHVETHNRAVESGLRALFSRLGWVKLRDYPCTITYPTSLEVETDWGVVKFQGGVQSWVNPKLVKAEDLVEFTAKYMECPLGFALWANPDDYVGKLLLTQKVYEPPETDAVLRLIRPGDVCIDAGCHIGYYSCLMGMLAGAEGRVYAFDANPWCCRRTRRQLAFNQLESVEVEHAALGEESAGTTPFFVSTDDQTGLSSLGALEPRKGVVSAPWMRLETFLKERGVARVRLLKLDVEGAEPLVLRGLGSFLTRHLVDFVVIELNDERLQLLNTTTSEAASILQSAGYSCWEYGTRNPSGWTETNQIVSREDCNYLFASPAVRDQIPGLTLSAAVTVSLQQQEVSRHKTAELEDERTQLQAQLRQVQNEVVSLKRALEMAEKSLPAGRGKLSLTTPAQALWNQRERMAKLSEKIRALSAAVNQPTDLTRYQWVQIMAFALDFRPDLIVELGRGMGNSTCCFLEVANQLGGVRACRLISLCLSDSWSVHTLPRLRQVVPADWFAPGEILRANILSYDFSQRVREAERVLVFWDAHGFAVAECVLGRLLPLLANKEHRVLMHDMSDIRYEIPNREYSEVGIWKGSDAADPAFWLGHIFSRVSQAISMVDFATRNELPLHSAVESLHAEFAEDPARLDALRELLGDEFFALQAHWFWFSLEEGPEKLVFPPFRPEKSLEKEPASVLDSVQVREEDYEWLMQNIRNLEEEVRQLRSDNRAWEGQWEAVQNSTGWRFLEAWRRWRDRWVPTGSVRRSLYDWALRKRMH